MLWRCVQVVICCDFGVVIVLICLISRFYQRGWSSTFVDALEDAKKKKDIAIERICAKNYLQLLRAVQEVHDLKAASAALKAAGRYWITCFLKFTLSIPFLHSLNHSAITYLSCCTSAYQLFQELETTGSDLLALRSELAQYTQVSSPCCLSLILIITLLS